MKRSPVLTSILLAFASFAFQYTVVLAQTVASGDTAKINARDSVSRIDTTASGGIDSVVAYKAEDTIQYNIHARTMHLVGKAEANYENQALKSEIIDLDFGTSELTAQGVPDSTGKSTLGTPLFNDKGEIYNGNTIRYNFKTKKGSVVLAQTKIDNGYYYGEKIKRESQEIMFVKDGKYTTCDLPHPHFYFASPKMEVILKHQVFAEPVYLYVDDVPVFAIPFAVFPDRAGRQSGLIPPAYGQETSRGFFLQHLGYFWAMNDYADLAATTDLYTKGSAVFDATLRYALRYDFNGGVTASYARTRFAPDDPISTQWSLGVAHHQTLDPTTRLDANLQFESPQYLRTTSTNANDILQAIIYSNASFSTAWEHSSLGLNYARQQDLSTGNINESPSLSFALQQLYPFRSPETSPGEEKWYELIGIAYSGNAKAAHNVVHDSLGSSNTLMYGALHSPSINFTPKLGHFSVTPSFNYSEIWYPERVIQSENPADSTVQTTTQHGFYRVWSYNAGVSASTRLYGLAYPNMFGITALRHTFQPAVSYTYQPDFSAPQYNYYGAYYDYRTNSNVAYSYFQNGIFGGPSAGKQQNIGLTFENNFEMKVRSGDTSETKVQLLNATLSSGYNFAADSFRLGTINLAARTNILGNVQVQGTAAFSPYYYDTLQGRYVDKYKWQMHDGLVNLTGFSFNASTSIALMQSGAAETDSASSARFDDVDTAGAPNGWDRFLGDDGEGNTPLRVPLSLSLGYSFTQLQPIPHHVSSRSSTLNATLTMKISPTLSVSASGFYDFTTGAFQVPSVNITKDLHCWEMNFIWYPTDPYLRGFYLELRIKAPQLNDIKITKRDNTRGLF